MHTRGQNMNPGSLNPKIIITVTVLYSLLRGPALKNRLELHWRRVHLNLLKNRRIKNPWKRLTFASQWAKTLESLKWRERSCDKNFCPLMLLRQLLWCWFITLYSLKCEESAWKSKEKGMKMKYLCMLSYILHPFLIQIQLNLCLFSVVTPLRYSRTVFH